MYLHVTATIASGYVLIWVYSSHGDGLTGSKLGIISGKTSLECDPLALESTSVNALKELTEYYLRSWR